MDTRINAIKFKHKQIKGLIQKPYFFILILFLVGIFAYGLYLPWMGFYWDDWHWIWFSFELGPKTILGIDARHRPLTGIVLYSGSIFFGQMPFGWQVYAFIFRILGTITLAWFLRVLWPDYKKKATLVSTLFLLYPGFTQQFVSVNNSRHLFPLITFFLSLGWMVKANQKKDRYWLFTGVSLVFSVITMFTTDYYYGLGLIRPVILGTMHYRQFKKTRHLLTNVLKGWLPYFVFLVGIFSWRYAVANIMDVNYSIIIFDRLSSSSQYAIPQLLRDVLGDFFELGFLAWFKVLQFPQLTFFSPHSGSYYWLLILGAIAGSVIYLMAHYSSPRKRIYRIDVVIALGSAVVITLIPFIVEGQIPGYYLNAYPNQVVTMLFGVLLLSAWALTAIFGGRLRFHDSQREITQNSWAIEAAIIATAALFLAPIPFWVTDFHIKPTLIFPTNRFTLPMMFGASLLIFSLIELLCRRNFSKIIILSALIGLLIGFHNQNASSYRVDWEYQVDFFQQLTTRIPDLEPGTAILFHRLENTRSDDEALTAPLDMIYGMENESGEIMTAIFNINRDSTSEDFDENSSFARGYLSFFHFKSAYPQTLAIYHQPPACLRVLDKELEGQDVISPPFSFMRAVLPLSNPDQIILDSQGEIRLPAMLAETPQPKDWCYYFEKAALARQREDWVEITRIGAIALNQFESTDYPSEYIPFIEGYAHMNQWEQAKTITYKALEINESITPMLCKTWDRIVDSTPATQERNQILEKTYAELGGCG